MRPSVTSFVPTKSACDLVRSTPLERCDIESLLGDLVFAESDGGLGDSGNSGGGGGARKEGDSTVSRIQLDAREFSKCIGRLLGNLGRTDQRVQIWQSLAFQIFATVRDEQQNPLSVNLQMFACVLSLFHRGTDVEERLRLCFSCFDVAQTGSISVADLKRVFEAAYTFFCPGIANDDIVSLAGKVVRNFRLGRRKKIDFANFSKFLLSVSVLSDLVRDVDGSQHDQPYAV
jgi:Ca2+-binding EF-hand superfamily protein